MKTSGPLGSFGAGLPRGVGHDLANVDREIAARGGELGKPIYVLPSTTSTNDEAKRAAKAGAPHGATWVAEAQTAGRGRQGRTWYSPPGEALLFSVLVRVPCPLPRIPTLALVAGLAVRDAVAAVTGNPRVGLKWPNDVVLSGKKVAGILVESLLAGRTLEALIVGIGVNVHTRAFPEDIAATATSVALIADEQRRASPKKAENVPELERASILADILWRLDRDVRVVAARGLGLVHARLVAADVLRGNMVTSERGSGLAEGIDQEGRLLVRGENGLLERWSAGEVHLIPPNAVAGRRARS